jgi:hypothetical protein
LHLLGRDVRRAYSAGIKEGAFQKTLQEKIELLFSVIDSWVGSGALRSMLETPDQWWIHTPAPSRRQAAKKAYGLGEARFLAFAKVLEKALAEQRQCGLEVLDNQSYQRTMPPYSYLG